MSFDGLSVSRTTPNRGATKFKSMDPRRRFLKPRSFRSCDAKVGR